jgi:phage baseplate assembly protein gpV
MSSILIYGTITKVYPSEGLAVVNFDDRDIASKKLPIIYPRTFKDQVSDPMEEGEHVACVMDSNLEDGVILGAIYSQADVPPDAAGANITVRKYKDGTIFKYDRTANEYSIKNGTTEFVFNKNTGFKLKKGSEDLAKLINDTLDGIIALTVTASPTGGPTSAPINLATFTAIKLRVTAFFGA